MLRKSICKEYIEISLAIRDKNKCKWIINNVIIQCIIVFIGAATVLNCAWSPNKAYYDYDKLARIMYLYDSRACGYSHSSISISELTFSNNTNGLNLLPITWVTAAEPTSTRLSTKTRKYIEISVALHVIWLAVALFVRFFLRTTNTSFLKVLLTILYSVFIVVIIFDVAMAIVYITHIQQSLTKSMVLRNTGWSVEMKLKSYDDFAGWLPITASGCWLRGIVLFCVNIYCARVIRSLKRKIMHKEIKTRIASEENYPIPEAENNYQNFVDTNKVLYFRSGESVPYNRGYGA